MAQVFPTSAQVIYDTIAADGSIMALAGEYTFKNGATNPALSILTPGSDLPQLSKTTGVEIVIHDVGDTQTKSYLTDESDLRITFPIFVICWGGATGSQMQEITNKICKHFLMSQALQTVATSDGIGALVQNKIFVYSDMPIVV